MKPKIFIGSSREGIQIANAIHSNLTRDAECTVWKDNVFQPSSSTLSDLMKMLGESDFAIFVFSPDDVSIMRSVAEHVVRDNVLFELGLFIGRLGQDRCFFLIPDSEQMRLPTDLSGFSPTKYESHRRDSNWEAAVNPACTQILRVVNKLGGVRNISKESFTEKVANTASEELSKSVHVAAAAKLNMERYKNSFLLKSDNPSHRARLSALSYASYNRTLQAWVIPYSKAAIARAELSDLL
jgi:predicted nucleotide-binding protein